MSSVGSWTEASAEFPASHLEVAAGTADAARVKRIAAYVSGSYQPLCALDAEYDGRARGTLGEEALMAALRLVTDATPRSVAR
jgi:hypothetical protein